MSNPYYNPEEFGLDLVGTVDIGDGWEFHMIIVWQNAAGEFKYAYDAGCSCHTPGDGMTMGNLLGGSYFQVAAKVIEFVGRATPEDQSNAVAMVTKMREMR